VAASLQTAAPPSANDDEPNQVTIPEELPYHHLDLFDIAVIEKGKIYDFKSRAWVTLDTTANVKNAQNLIQQCAQKVLKAA
jgi:hypothetical protein